MLQHSNKSWLNPITFKTNGVFIIIATLFLALAGWLMQIGILPSFAETSLSQRYSPWSIFIPLKLWMQLAVVLSLILPIFVLFVCWHVAIVRRLMLLYLFVLLVHIPTEIVFNKLGLPGMNFVVGFTYTTYKVWQLWCYKKYLGKQKQPQGIKRSLVMVVFLGGIAFWTLNWLFLGINLITRTIGA